MNETIMVTKVTVIPGKECVTHNSLLVGEFHIEVLTRPKKRHIKVESMETNRSCNWAEIFRQYGVEMSK